MCVAPPIVGVWSMAVLLRQLLSIIYILGTNRKLEWHCIIRLIRHFQHGTCFFGTCVNFRDRSFWMACQDVHRMGRSIIIYDNNNTQKAAIATLPLTTHPQWAETHTFTCTSTLEKICACTNHIIGMAQLTTPAIPTIPQLTILTKIPPRGVRLGARTCIITIQSHIYYNYTQNKVL